MKIEGERLSELLHKHFRFSSFRKGQLEAIESILAMKDVMAVMPTSAGKSLCYQLPALYSNKLVIVISPLISLMNDQVRSLKALGIPAGSLHSGISLVDQRKVFAEISENVSYLLYLSPERAYNTAFAKWIEEKEIALFAIDEAHCVSQWGHDFRPEYAKLNFLKEVRPDVPIMALTATATPVVLKDIADSLKLNNPEKIINGFYRPNLYYQVEHCEDEDDKMQFIKNGIDATPVGRIIIYCAKRTDVEELGALLNKKYGEVGIYHAGMTTEDRVATQHAYSSGELRILCATNAFGMGIDQPDVRLVIHHRFPKNIESLYQEMGRAGRDGLDSTCLVLFDKSDLGLQSFFIKTSKAPQAVKNAQWKNLDLLIDYCESEECRHGEILTYFRDPQKIKRCEHCDFCDPLSSRKITLKTKHKIEVKKAVVKKKKKSSKKSKKGSVKLTASDEFRYEALKEWRKRKADALDVPAFIIFSNKTLQQIAKINPQTLDELLDINGIGPVKLEQFGHEILKLL